MVAPVVVVVVVAVVVFVVGVVDRLQSIVAFGAVFVAVVVALRSCVILESAFRHRVIGFAAVWTLIPLSQLG